MAAILIVTNAQPELARDMSVQIAQSMGYSTQQIADWSFAVQQGNLVASIFLGAFIAYCDFKLHVSGPGDGTVHIVLERNNPWWTGYIGCSRVKGRANDLMNAIHNTLGQQGYAILDRRDV
jgi:hypothetical protein